jgi:uncharacterized membrane protein YqjE
MALFAPSSAKPGKPGVLASLRRLGATLVEVLHTRAELLAREFERERVRITRLLLLGVVALFFLALGAITFTIFIIVLFWDSQRLVAIGFLTVLYFAIAIGLALSAKREAAQSAKPFASTVAQLKKDREEFFSRH